MNKEAQHLKNKITVDQVRCAFNQNSLKEFSYHLKRTF